MRKLRNTLVIAFLVCSAIFVGIGVTALKSIDHTFATVNNVQTLLNNYYNQGYYSKETVIFYAGNNAEFFHAKANSLARKTTYEPGRLYMSNAEGTINSGYKDIDDNLGHFYIDSEGNDYVDYTVDSESLRSFFVMLDELYLGGEWSNYTNQSVTGYQMTASEEDLITWIHFVAPLWIGGENDGVEVTKAIIYEVENKLYLEILNNEVLFAQAIINKVAPPSQGLRYEINEDGETCTITGIGTCSDRELVIPTIIDGYKVTRIGDEAFEEELFTSIIISDSVTTIGDNAFSYCVSLTSVKIGDSVTTIGAGAFRHCRRITVLEMGNSVTTIGDSAFNSCSGIVSLDIPDSVVTIGGTAFFSCTGVNSLTIGKGVKKIGYAAFEYLSNLRYIYYTAVDCQDLSNENHVFNQAGRLKSGIILTIDADVKRIPAYLFSPVNNPTSVTAPKIIELNFEDNAVCSVIGERAFYNCESLKSIEIPDTVTEIGKYAFTGCQISSAKIPATAIASASIRSDYIKIVEITSGESIPNSAFMGCDSLTSVVIPDSVTSIGDSAFYSCYSLTSIKIPNTVTSIGSYAFRSCDSLTIYCEAESQPSGWNANWNYSNCPVVWGYKG